MLDGTIRLCHGTSWQHYENICRYGIRPRGEAPSMWPDCPSHPDRVYLSNAYSFHFAASAAGHKEDLLVVEVEVDIDDLYPDEDYLAQAAPEATCNIYPDIIDRTKYFRDMISRINPLQRRELAIISLSAIGNVSHHGILSPERIRRVAKIPADKVSMIILREFDPTITTMNYRFMGKTYREFQESIFKRFPLDVLA